MQRGNECTQTGVVFRLLFVYPLQYIRALSVKTVALYIAYVNIHEAHAVFTCRSFQSADRVVATPLCAADCAHDRHLNHLIKPDCSSIRQ